MTKTILRGLALLVSVIGFFGFLFMPLFDQRFSYRGEWRILGLAVLYFLATSLSLAAVFWPRVPQWLRYPGVIANVLVAVFVLGVWAKWLTGNMPMKGLAGLVPCLGTTAFFVLLLWVLDTHKVFRPPHSLSIVVAIVTLLACVLPYTHPRPRLIGQPYSDQLQWLDTLATGVGAGIVVASLTWLVYLIVGVRGARQRMTSSNSVSQ